MQFNANKYINNKTTSTTMCNIQVEHHFTLLRVGWK